MAASKAKNQQAEAGTDPDLPHWKQQSVERSLLTARARAQERSDRFVAAAIELMEVHGSTDFTVQDIIDRAHMSIRTFYNYFASKDDLLVAVYETVLAEEVVPRLRKLCMAKRDPVARVRAYVDALYELTADPGPVYRALTTYRNRLAESRPDDLERASRPQVAFIEELLRGAETSGRLRSDLPLATAAVLLHNFVLANVHARILGSSEALAVTADELWSFCSAGMGLSPAERKRR